MLTLKTGKKLAGFLSYSFEEQKIIIFRYFITLSTVYSMGDLLRKYNFFYGRVIQ